MRINVLVATLLIIVSSNLLAQVNEYRFTPEWKVGDKKTAIVEQHETSVKSGEVEEDTTTYLEITMNVLKEDKESYILKVLYENVALLAAINFYDKLGDELKDYKKLELKYSVNKQTGESELINWKEAQKFMNDSFDKIDALLKKKVPDMAGFAKLALAPIKESFKSKENVEAYMSDQVGYLLYPYDKKFVIGDTLSTKESVPNPFNPMDTISQTTLSCLSRVDEAKKIAYINISELLDLTEFKQMMKSMMEKMASAFGADDAAKEKAAGEIDKLEFDMINTTVVEFNYASTWSEKVTKTVKVVANDPRGKSEKTVLTTVTIK